MSHRQQSINAYRNIIRASRSTFKNDKRILEGALLKARTEFRANAGETEIQKIESMIKHAENIAIILKKNVVQAWEKPEEKGTYQMRITEHTELADNDTIKQPKSTPTKVKRCS